MMTLQVKPLRKPRRLFRDIYPWKKCKICNRWFPIRPQGKKYSVSPHTIRPWFAVNCSRGCTRKYDYYEAYIKNKKLQAFIEARKARRNIK